MKMKNDNYLRFILLLGPQNSGKTTTFVLLRQQLLLTASESNYEQLGADPRDFSAVYTLENRKIYVCSMGDYQNMIEQSIAHARKHECDTAVFAYNTQFSQTYIQHAPQASITLRKRIATIPPSEDIENNLDVNDLMWLLRI